MIKNLHTALAEQGKIKIGKKGKTKKSKDGADYQEAIKDDFFTLTTLERDGTPEKNFKVDDEAMKGLPKEPKSLRIELLYDDTALNFPNSYAMFNTDGLFCLGDGETAQRGGKEIPCDTNTCKFFKSKTCKISGILVCRLSHLKNLMGVYKFRTHSWNSVKNILAALHYIQTLTGDIVAGIPLEMKVVKKSTKHGIIKVVTLEPVAKTDDELADALEKVIARRRRLQIDIHAVEEKAIKSGVTQDTDDPDDVKAEFYPGEKPELTQEERDDALAQAYVEIAKIWREYDVNEFEQEASVRKFFHIESGDISECWDIDRLEEYAAYKELSCLKKKLKRMVNATNKLTEEEGAKVLAVADSDELDKPTALKGVNWVNNIERYRLSEEIPLGEGGIPE